MKRFPDTLVRTLLGLQLAVLSVTAMPEARAEESSLLETEFYPAGSRYGLDLRSGNVAGESASLVGAHWLAGYSNGLSFGIAAHGLASKIAAPVGRGTGQLSYYYAGLHAEYEVFSYSIFNLSASTLIGVGRTGYRRTRPGATASVVPAPVLTEEGGREESPPAPEEAAPTEAAPVEESPEVPASLLDAGASGSSSRVEWKQSSFRVIEPGVVATVNLSSRARLGFGAWYRFVVGVNSDDYSSGDLGGPVLGVTIRTGIW